MFVACEILDCESEALSLCADVVLVPWKPEVQGVKRCLTDIKILQKASDRDDLV